MGTAAADNELMIRWAYKYKCIVFNVEYRLAPEAKAPGGQRDFMHVYLHLLENINKYNVDKKKIVFAGDSGGAYICFGASY